ncbi:MAG: VC0807 family protein [Verrucomicrobiota bacterium]
MSDPKKKPENLFVNLICNIILPSLVFSKTDDLLLRMGQENLLQPTAILLIAVSIPLGYGIYDYITRRAINLFSILGFANVGLTGVIGILELDGLWVAVKEASLPAIFGILVVASSRSRNPLIKTIFYNPSVIDVDKVNAIIEERNARDAFEKLFKTATKYFLFSSAIGVILNFVLARIIVTSSGGSPEFNEQMGKMTFISYFVIAAPTLIISMFAMWKLFTGITKITDLKLEEMMLDKQASKAQ